MATLNQMEVVGVLVNDPLYNEQTDRIMIKVNTVRRDVVASDSHSLISVNICYDNGTSDTTLMPRLKALKRGDLILAKGVLNIQPAIRRKVCPNCGQINEKRGGVQMYMYVTYLKKLDTVAHIEDVSKMTIYEFLHKHYHEISHQLTVMGFVVSKPRLKKQGDLSVCMYKLGVNRSYYISSQASLTADYPWVYSFGEQAERDMRYLVPANPENDELGSLVFIKGFMRNELHNITYECDFCHSTYQQQILASSIAPYNIEYLSGHKTDADIAAEEELRRRESLGI